MMTEVTGGNRVVSFLGVVCCVPRGADFSFFTGGGNVEEQLRSILNDRIMIIDGAMGTQIQDLKLTEEDYRGFYYSCLLSLWGRKVTPP